MGYFSWITQDTEQSIPNVDSSREPFKVVMTDNKGNKWIENSYEGYGVFGGKDFYELLAEMNGVIPKPGLEGEDYTEYMREKGIEIAFKNNPDGDHTPGVLYPNLSHSENWVWGYQGPISCPDQGFFYDEDDDDDDDWFLDEC